MLNAPPPPEFGQPLPVEPSPEALALLALRRSASAAALTAPGPSAGELDVLLRLAARVPDHGKLSPWRFIVIGGEDKAAFVRHLGEIARSRPDPEKSLAALGKAAPPPLAVVVVSRVTGGIKIPEWEQELSAGAVCMNLLLAAHAAGYGANWLTDWYGFDPDVAALLGLVAGERVAGFVYLGTAASPPLERVRPDLSSLVTRWRDA